MHVTHLHLPASKSTQQGFTLIELIVTFSIVAVLAMLAVPNMTNWLRGWQRDSATRDFSAHLQLARSEAIKSSRNVVMCVSSDAASCDNSTDWTKGWIVFVDTNSNNAVTTGEVIVATRGAISGLTSMQSKSSPIKLLAFLPNGLLSSGATTMVIKPRSGGTLKFNEITVSRVGRAYLKPVDPS